MKNRVLFGIRIKFFIAFFISITLGLFTFIIFNGEARNSRTDYAVEIANFDSETKFIVEKIKLNLQNNTQIKRIIYENFYKSNRILEIFLLDNDGNVINEPPNYYISKMNLADIINAKNISNYSTNKIRYTKIENVDNSHYVVITTIITKSDHFEYIILGIPVSIISFFILTYKKINYIKLLSNSLKVISEGDLNHSVPVNGSDEVSFLAKNINKLATELTIRKAKEEKSENIKNELIMNVSHDLKTPLTSIIGYIKLLKERSQYYDDLSKYLNIIDEKSKRLETLINDLLEYTMLTDCNIILSKNVISLNELIRQIIEGLLPLGVSNNIKILYQPLETDMSVKIDADKIARAFENLISNAIKYSVKPGIVEIRVFKYNQDYNKIIISIFNKGILNQDEIEKVFERLYRSDSARNSSTGGSGIGLSIAKSIIELHNGNVWVKSSNNNIWFYVKLPIYKVLLV
ncbi:MAG: HAMP domain-containing sensor histidine kinase [Clostridiales bacterium]